jgi:hypothetical protein
MSMVASRAFFWERTLLMSDFTSLLEPVGVPTSPGYAMLLSPMVMRVQSALSCFSGITLQTTLGWVY